MPGQAKRTARTSNREHGRRKRPMTVLGNALMGKGIVASFKPCEPIESLAVFLYR